MNKRTKIRWRKLLRSRPVVWIARLSTALRWGVRILLALLVLDLFYLAITWPNWKSVAAGPISKSAFMRHYEQEPDANGRPRHVRWQPVPLSSISKSMQRAVVLAEDSRFWEHSGFDLAAFKEALDRNIDQRRFAFGASTISQQTVKNLYLSRSKTPLRKWHELVLTWGMEHHVKKQRILELYLNVVEFGPGIYGVQAAAQAYWGINASQLDPRQAAELAAALPSPARNNPARRSAYFQQRSARILRLLVRFPGDAAEAVNAYQGVPPSVPDNEMPTEPSPDCDNGDCPQGDNTSLLPSPLEPSSPATHNAASDVSDD